MEIKRLTISDSEDFLRKKSLVVDIKNDKHLNNDIKVLEEFCLENEVMAMAAVQLGILKRLIYLKNTNLDLINKSQTDSLSEEEKLYNEARVMINPVILKKEGLTEYWENCASCLGNCGRVLRPYKIKLEYFDIGGVKHIQDICGFEATVICHEIDHLDGILHIDISEEVIFMSKEERKKWRQTHGYKVYKESGDYDLLLKENSVKFI